MSIFTKRLKEAAVSQEWLGILAGIDEMSASARMNQYGRGKYEPEFSMSRGSSMSFGCRNHTSPRRMMTSRG